MSNFNVEMCRSFYKKKSLPQGGFSETVAHQKNFTMTVVADNEEDAKKKAEAQSQQMRDNLKARCSLQISRIEDKILAVREVETQQAAA